jgi:hypothetical protein
MGKVSLPESMLPTRNSAAQTPEDTSYCCTPMLTYSTLSSTIIRERHVRPENTAEHSDPLHPSFDPLSCIPASAVCPVYPNLPAQLAAIDSVHNGYAASERIMRDER